VRDGRPVSTCVVFLWAQGKGRGCRVEINGIKGVEVMGIKKGIKV